MALGGAQTFLCYRWGSERVTWSHSDELVPELGLEPKSYDAKANALSTILALLLPEILSSLGILSPWSLTTALLWQCPGGAECLLSSHIFMNREPKAYWLPPFSSYAKVSSLDHLTKSSWQVGNSLHLNSSSRDSLRWHRFHLWTALVEGKFFLVAGSDLPSWSFSLLVWSCPVQATLSGPVLLCTSEDNRPHLNLLFFRPNVPFLKLFLIQTEVWRSLLGLSDISILLGGTPQTQTQTQNIVGQELCLFCPVQLPLVNSFFSSCRVDRQI